MHVKVETKRGVAWTWPSEDAETLSSQPSSGYPSRKHRIVTGMNSGKKKTCKGSRGSKKTTHTPRAEGEIQRFFTQTQEAPKLAKMADHTTSHHEGTHPQEPSVSPAASDASEVYSETQAVFHSEPQYSQQQPLTLRADTKLQALLQALPTRMDIEALIGKLEATHQKEM